MINVSKIRKGLVIDHIKEGQGFVLYKHLGLDRVDGVVVLMTGILSEKMGKKDLIKIETDFDIPMDLVGFFASQSTVNFIEDGQVVKKEKIDLPETLEDILSCPNPACVSNHQDVPTRFHLLDKERARYGCAYCDQEVERERI